MFDHKPLGSLSTYKNGQRVAFLDRDGTICWENPLERAAEPVELIPGSDEAIKILKEHGYYIVVVTNQPRVTRGESQERRLREILGELDIEIRTRVGEGFDYVLYCPHDDDDCPWRKPNPGMLEYTKEHTGCDLSKSVIIGDSYKDVLAGQRVGALSIQVRTTNTVSADPTEAPQTYTPGRVEDDLLAAVTWLVSKQ